MTPLGWLIVSASLGSAAWVCLLARTRVQMWRLKAEQAQRVIDEQTTMTGHLYHQLSALTRRDLAWYDALAQMRGKHRGES